METEIEKIKLLSQLMGQEVPKDSELLKMMETAKKMQNFFHTEQPEYKMPLTTKEDTTLFTRTKEENMIYASIPFLDKEYQKYLYVIVRVLEMKRVLEGNELLETRSRTKDDPKKRRKNLLQAIRPYLTGEEKQKIDFVVKAMDIKNIMEWKEEITWKKLF